MSHPQRMVATVFFFGLLLVVMWQLLEIFSPFFQAFFWASVLSFAFHPVYQALNRRLNKDNLSASITTLIVFLIVILPSLFVLANLINQTFDIFQYLSNGGLNALTNGIKNLSWLENLRLRISGSETLSQYITDLPLRLTRTMGDATAGYIAMATKNTVLILFNCVLLLFMLFILTRDGVKIYNFIYDLTPLDETNKSGIFLKMNETFSSVIRGQFLTSLSQGMLAGVAFLILGLPAPYFFGFLTFISSLVPVIGASGVWLPVAIYLLIQQEFAKGISLFLIGVFIISLSDNILKPAFIGTRMKMPPFLLFLGILGGLRIYGMMGMFLGPLLITLFFVLIKIYRENYCS